jgi:hypothetical protein
MSFPTTQTTETIMFMTQLRPALVLGLALTTGCEKAADLRNDAVTAQNEANTEIANTRSDAKKDVLDAQAEADRKIAAAQADFTKMREEYRHNTTQNLAPWTSRSPTLRPGRRRPAARRSRSSTPR